MRGQGRDCRQRLPVLQAAAVARAVTLTSQVMICLICDALYTSTVRLPPAAASTDSRGGHHWAFKEPLQNTMFQTPGALTHP